MEMTAALDLINNQLCYKSGWTFAAYQPIGSIPLIHVTVNITTVNSNKEFAPEYKSVINAGTDEVFAIDPDMTEDEFLMMVFAWVMSVEMHEAREFFRLRNRDMNAPFHPHVESCERLFQTLSA